MDLNLDILTTARALAAHAADRQNVIAANIANADTPGYRARDMTPFSDSFDSAAARPFDMRATRPGHIRDEPRAHSAEIKTTTAFGAAAPNGNTVSLEDQMMRSAEVRHSHDLALGVYRKSLDILRISLGR